MPTKTLKIEDKYVRYLETQPEQGMGYQIVDIFLKNGTVLKSRMIFNCTYLQLDSDENIEIDDIIKITSANNGS